MAHRIGTGAGLLYSVVPGSLRNAALTNMRVAFPAISNRELKRLARRSAVQEGRIYPIDPFLLSVPGPRLVDGLEEQLNPDRTQDS